VISPVVQTRLSPADVDEVRALIDTVTRADGTPPLSDHVMLHLPGGGDVDARHVLARVDGALVGYGHLDVTDVVEGASGELAVHPAYRNRGIGRALAEELYRQSTDGRLRLWAHGEHPAAAKMAAAGGYVKSRVLWQMRRSLQDPLPSYELPPGVDVRTFVVGQDEAAWTAVNNRAFAHHPDQGGWGVHEVMVREQEPWFDPAGFFLAFRGEELVGFHWTKVHGGHTHAADEPAHQHDHQLEHHAHEAIGEVYVVGVDPSAQGIGLGPVLTLIGLHHLRDKGLHNVMLYVDETNTFAIRVYERLGFTRHTTDVCFSRGG
jgi:mycothiol synthase